MRLRPIVAIVCLSLVFAACGGNAAPPAANTPAVAGTPSTVANATSPASPPTAQPPVATAPVSAPTMAPAPTEPPPVATPEPVSTVAWDEGEPEGGRLVSDGVEEFGKLLDDSMFALEKLPGYTYIVEAHDAAPGLALTGRV